MGAKVAGLASCNGWTFWHFERKKNDDLLPLDTLRQQLKSEIFC